MGEQGGNVPERCIQLQEERILADDVRYEARLLS